MSERTARGQTRLWLVRRTDGVGSHLFCGSLQEMALHIGRLHRESGVQHAARELEG